MTTSLLPQRLTQPVRLTLGESIGLELQRHYAINFWLQRTVARVDQRPQIALIAPPTLYAAEPPSTCVHTFKPYLVDTCEERDCLVAAHRPARWRYDWLTRCKRFALRVSIPEHAVILHGTTIEVYAEIPAWYRVCGTCANHARKER